MRLLGRDAWVINLDPANEGLWTPIPSSPPEEKETGEPGLPYEALFDVCTEIINLTSVMEKTQLGPNGGLIYCMEYLEEHAEEIVEAIQSRLTEKMYLIIDLPGQVELFTHNECVQNLLNRMVRAWDMRLTVVQLMDAFYCTDASKFLSATLLGTTTMLRLELPTVSVLSKVDLLHGYGELPFNFDFFTECHDLERLLPFLDQSGSTEDIDVDIADDEEYQKARARRRKSRFFRKFARLHESLADVVQDFGLLHFSPLDISNAASVGRIVSQIDKANGYVFTDDGDPSNLFHCAVQNDDNHETLSEIQERIVHRDENQRKVSHNLQQVK